MIDAFICDPIRTPIGRYGGALATVRADDLAAVPIAALLERNANLDPVQIEDLAYGCANQAGEDNRNVARMSSLLAGLPQEVPACTINRLCGSGLNAVGSAAASIRAGEGHLMIGGGVESMSRSPWVIGKAEITIHGENPRFVVTSLADDPRTVYEAIYCARGDMENRIKEQQLGLFADRTSTATLRANQLRLYFSSFAYVLLQGLRRLGLAGTAHAKAQSTTIRLKLLKIGARIRITVRKVWLSFSEAYPYADDIAQILANLHRHPAWAPPD